MITHISYTVALHSILCWINELPESDQEASHPKRREAKNNGFVGEKIIAVFLPQPVIQICFSLTES